MKQVLTILFSILICNGYGQELKTLSEVELNEFKSNKLFLEKGWSISIEPDPEWVFHIIEFKKNDELKLKDSVDLTSYGFNFRLLQLNGGDDFILIIEAIYEFASDYPIYRIRQENISKIGNLNIGLDCSNCDALNYPLNDLIIKGNDKKVEFSFKKDLVLMDKKEFSKLKKDEIKIVYELTTKKLKIIKSTGANTR